MQPNAYARASQEYTTIRTDAPTHTHTHYTHTTHTLTLTHKAHQASHPGRVVLQARQTQRELAVINPVHLAGARGQIRGNAFREVGDDVAARRLGIEAEGVLCEGNEGGGEVRGHKKQTGDNEHLWD